MLLGLKTVPVRTRRSILIPCSNMSFGFIWSICPGEILRRTKTVCFQNIFKGDRQPNPCQWMKKGIEIPRRNRNLECNCRPAERCVTVWVVVVSVDLIWSVCPFLLLVPNKRPRTGCNRSSVQDLLREEEFSSWPSFPKGAFYSVGQSKMQRLDNLDGCDVTEFNCGWPSWTTWS